MLSSIFSDHDLFPFFVQSYTLIARCMAYVFRATVCLFRSVLVVAYTRPHFPIV
jgi:hypothetical protein